MSVEFTNPPRHIKENLELTVKQRYPELSEDISYFATYYKVKDVITAEVNFYGKGSKPVSAYFEYQYNRSTGEYYWYCVRDWND